MYRYKYMDDASNYNWYHFLLLRRKKSINKRIEGGVICREFKRIHQVMYRRG